MPIVFKHYNKNKDNGNMNKYDRYALERIERKLNKITDLVYSFLRK